MTWRGDMLGFGIAEDLGPKEEPEQRVAPPASNDIRLNGTNIAGLSSAEVARRGTGYVARGLFAGMTVAQTFSLGARPRA